MEIVIIGTGNVASILGKKLKAAGHDIVQIFGRNATAASELAYELDTESTNYWSVVNRNADLYIIAVSDIAIEEVVQELQLPDKIIVHTAASVSKDILKNFTHYGVFYPLQSLTKSGTHLPDVPVLIDASDEATLQLLQQLAFSMSDKVAEADDALRAKIHLAAVFCNNFVNHLYHLTEQYCKKEDIDFKLFIPLIKETALRLDEVHPALAQTGPAARKDITTIEKHKALLETYPEHKAIYNLLTQSIIQSR